MAQNKVVERNGFIYGPGTAKGFLRMERQGFPRPVFSIEKQVKSILQKQFSRILKEMLADFRKQAVMEGLHVAKDNSLTTDGQEGSDMEELRQFFEDFKSSESAANESIKRIEFKSKLQSMVNNLENEWDLDDLDDDPIPDLAYEHHLADLLMRNQEKFIRRLQNDGPQLDHIIQRFSLDKQKLFDDNMDALRKLYLDNCRQRIKGEENLLKRRFLEKLNDYVIGKSDKLDVTDIVKNLYTSGEHMAQFFARDQLARFNKATTLATYQSAGVTKIKWITSRDARVRDSHKALDGQIFNIRELPPEIDDYNCRCGFVPVEWAD